MVHHINGIKDKNYVTPSINVERSSGNIKYPFIIKTNKQTRINKLVIENFFNLIKLISKTPIDKSYW